MPRKSPDKKLDEILSEAGYAYSWLKNLPEFEKAWEKTVERKPSPKETAKIKSIFGFIPEEPSNVFPLELITALQNIQKTPYNQNSVILYDPLNYDLCERTKDGKLIDPNENVYDGPMGPPPEQISVLIYWDYPTLNIMHRIEIIIKKIKYLHQIPDLRPRNRRYVVRICNKKSIYKNKRMPTEIITLEINWFLCPGAIIKYLKPIIERVKNSYQIKDSRPQYNWLSNRYKTHVMTKLGYSNRQIQTELLKSLYKDPTDWYNDPSESYRKRAFRIAKKGASRFL